ncbi:class I SAM-dependent methyltransferase [Confluentibacter sediminis]|uniref:class I SAM-dependent methyltransferase n=1 Tax=Confluentibacter sediminis TaxID=2219045 RepID=UPI000DAC7AEC|nr:class I SAM-dependent methyltransferase [Confluentibacter sediminis]
MNNQNEEDNSEKFLEFLTNTIYHLENNNRLNRFFSEDILSVNFLNTIIHGYPYLPFSGSSLRPFCLNHILNDIVINNRKNIIEFGSGISTILIGRLIKKNNLDTSIISIEHDLEWSQKLSQLLSNENLDGVVSVLHCPLEECKLALDNNLWYSTEILDSVTESKTFDMIIVDGPPAWIQSKGRSRYPAFPYMIDKLDENYSIYLDDAMREGEQSIIKLWEEEFLIKFKHSGNSLAYYYNGISFFTEPYVYY